MSYVRFCNPAELVSASTDSTLRMWSLAAAAAADGDGTEALQRVFEGHVNEKNFVGLAGVLTVRGGIEGPGRHFGDLSCLVGPVGSQTEGVLCDNMGQGKGFVSKS